MNKFRKYLIERDQLNMMWKDMVRRERKRGEKREGHCEKHFGDREK